MAGVLFACCGCAAGVPDLALTNAGGTVSLALRVNGTADGLHPINSLELRAFGQQLLGRLPALGTNGANTPLAAWAQAVLVNGRGPDLTLTNPLPILAQARGGDWQYAAADFTPAYVGRLTRFHRHLLLVEPDLIVVYDDLASAKPMELAFQIQARGPMVWDDRSQEARLDLTNAGLTVHCLLPRFGDIVPWSSAITNFAPNNPGSGGSVFRVFATNQLQEVRLLTVLVPHRAGQKRGLGFRRLETATAVGARVFRDGLPALVAFRTDSSASGPASLIGMEFTGPVGVNVYQPKRRFPQDR